MQVENKYLGFDFLRGFAAFLVVISHLRNFLFVDFADITNPSVFDRGVYFVTGLGHQAVIVFFVLSGFFVGGSVWSKVTSDNFNFVEYLITRLSRLWVVLLPALLFTFICDTFGNYLAPEAGYMGAWNHLISSGPEVEEGAMNLGAADLIGNVLFLQTILVPVYGSNGPLWSLAYEFWYYLMFPLLLLSWFKRDFKCCALFLIITASAYFLNAAVLVGFIYWLLGWGASMWVNSNSKVSWVTLALSIVVFSASLVVSKFVEHYIGEGVVALSTTILLLSLPIVKTQIKWLKIVTFRFADFSYTLYLFHFPFLAFYWFVFVAPNQTFPSMNSYLNAFFVLLVTIAFSYCMYFLFESRTIQVRRWLLARLSTR